MNIHNGAKRSLTIIIAMTILATLFLGGCSQGGNSVNTITEKDYRGTVNLMEGVPVSTELSDDEIKKGLGEEESLNYCKFATSLFKAGLFDEGTDPQGNLLISPLSVIYAMSMVTNGADGMTRTELLEALTTGESFGAIICGTSGSGEGDIYDEWQGKLNTYLRAYMNVVEKYRLEEEEFLKNWYANENNDMKPSSLKIANSIWMKDDPKLTVEEDFLKTNGEFYDAGIRKTQFNEEARKAINSWIENHTDGTIKDMLKEIPDTAIMYLINALAFQGEWESPYNEYQIQEGEFHGYGGATQVDFMTGDEYFYLEDDRATGFIKPYVGQNYAFAALLPKEGVALEDYVAELTGEHIHELLKSPIEHEVIAKLPKFESESAMSLKSAMKGMGVRDAFDVMNADFSKLGRYEGENILIGDILHNTYIKVDEKGTKAGAATIVEMVCESAMIEEEPSKYVTLDRPFVYMLIDMNQHIPLFIGVMRDI